MPRRIRESDALPPADLWPDRSAAADLGYPAALNLSVELVDRHVPVLENKIAIHAPDATLTYGQLADRVARLAHVLAAAGIVAGDRVLLRLPNGAALAGAWLAVQRAGAIAVATFAMLRARELDAMIADAEPAAAIVHVDLIDEWRRTRAADHAVVVLVAGVQGDVHGAVHLPEGTIDLDERAAAAPGSFEAVLRPRDAVATIIYTADVDGLPARGVCHSAADWLATADTYARFLLCADRDDVFGGSPPFAFAYGLGALLLFPLRVGATTSTTSGFDAAALAASIARDRITLLFGTPTSYRLLMRMPDFDNRARFESVRLAIASGERLDPAVAEEWIGRTRVPLVDGFGTTEMAHIFLSQLPADLQPGTLGRAMPGYEVRVVDDRFQEAAPGVAGRLIARGPTGCRYWRRPDAQRRTVCEGWTLTGDLVVRDVDGALRYVGRADDLIVSAGYNVSGLEVARVLREHPDVADAVVIAAPDPVRGAVPLARVVLRPAARGRAGLTLALQQHVQQTLAPYKVPRRFEFVDALPRST